ncbi:mechanosensitive ion channel family protein [Pedobacter cryoconitis]|uniref:Small-conductance mechanosensitive channel n=1 Tax=Pedobacter cryoconitis TaxID=188932 RepID=A0A7X0MGM0_9SPHI|nr:mechanosensitive ion channel family protein [Pedobacter cryoconitis]MBB6498452.1 small-conductance mechanosensitive channel [Pedobacter cryoconitis]
MRLKLFLFSISLLVFTASYGQDSVKKDTQNINEALLLKDQQQQKIDSLVKIQLKNELQLAAGNSKKTLELEKKIRQIAVNDSLRKIQQLEKIQVLKKNAKGYPVRLNTDTLFYIFVRTGSFSALERAEAISKKIVKLYDDPFYKADSLVVSPNENSFDLIYKDNDVLMTVGNLDGLWFAKSNEQLAKEYLHKIKQSIAAERKANSLVNWLKRIGLVVLIIALLTVIISVINRLFKRIASFLSSKRESYLNLLKVRNIKIFTPEHFENVLLRINNIFRIAVIILIIYLSLPLLFSIFPETEAWTGTLLGWILSPLQIALNAIAHYLPNLFTVMVIYFIFKYVIKGVKYFFYEIKLGQIQLRGFHSDWAIPTFNILKVILYAFMLILIFPYLPGSGSPAFQGVSVFLGILISLGSSSAITNIVAGLVITYMRPFKIGDRVKIGEVVGDVLEKTMLVTRIKTIKNEDITVPNSMVLSSSTINYSSHTRKESQGLIVHQTLTLGYDIPFEHIYNMLTQAALKTEYILSEPKPFVLQTSLDDFYISYQINAYTKEANKQAIIYSKLFENIQNEFNAAGVEIMSPHYTAMRDGNASAMPPAGSSS